MVWKVHRATEKQMVPLNEIKVVFLGDGGAGKSYTIGRLMNDGGALSNGYYDSEVTPGIGIYNKEYDLDGRRIKVRFWDFGGQEILHSMHRIFLTSRTMYVVLLNARDDTQTDRAQYWLQNIHRFAPGSPVLLVLNKIDQNQNASIDEWTLRSKYSNLTQIVRLSARAFDQAQFNHEFTDVLLAEIRKCPYLNAQWPRSWVRVKERLENKLYHYITGTDYEKICRECGVDSNRTELLHWLNDLGVSFCCGDSEDTSLNRHVVLRPDWITNALYIILFNELQGARNGLIPHHSIYKVLKQASMDASIRCTLPNASYDNPGDVEYILGVMRQFQFSLDTGHGYEFIPMLSQQNSTVDIYRLAKDSDTLEFRMVFDYLPNNLLHQLMLERRTELDMNHVWHTGAQFHLKEMGLSAVVVIEGNVLKFFIHHTDSGQRPSTYLTILKGHVEQIGKKLGLPTLAQQIVYKLDGNQEAFDYEELEQALKSGDTHIYSRAFRRRIAIEDILNPARPYTYKSELTKQLVTDITRACAYLPRGPLPPTEEEMTRILKDYLSGRGYIVLDRAPIGGTTLSEKSGGSPDLFLVDEHRKPLTVIEGMCINTSDVRPWDLQLTKLLHQFTLDLSSRFLICYVKCEKDAYERYWNRYREHMRRYAPGRSELVYGSYTELESEYNDLRVVCCRYMVGGKEITVYHYFVRVETGEDVIVQPQPPKPVEKPSHSGLFTPSQQPEPPTTPQSEEKPEVADSQEHEPTAAQQQEPPRQTNEILQDYRVVFLGDSEAGKTLLQARLNEPEKDPRDFQIDTTLGINIIQKTETIGNQLVRVNYWDFGGQEILHSMHRIFLAENTLYVIILNTRNDNHEAQAIFWLRYVEVYAPKSPVLLVLNKIDQNRRATLNLAAINRLFPNRQFEQDDVLRISAMWRGDEHGRFQEEFAKKLNKSIEQNGFKYDPYTKEQAKVLARIEEMKNTVTKDDRIKIITSDQFRAICSEAGVTEWEKLMDRFNETGVLVYHKGKIPMYMNPAWITDTLYRILEKGDEIADNGVVLHAKLQEMCYQNPDSWRESEDAVYLRDIMRDYDLSFQYEQYIPGNAHTADKEFIPMLCRREEPKDIEDLVNAENTVEIQMVFEYLPCGLLYKILVDHHNQLDRKHIWLTGMKLDRKNGSSFAVVRQEGNTMSIFVHDDNISDALEWMQELQGKIADEAKYGKYHATLLETKLGYKIADVKEYFDYQQLKNAEIKGVYYTVSRNESVRQKVAISDILRQKDGSVLNKIDELLKYTSKGCQKLQGIHTYWFLAPDVKDDRRVPKMDEDGRTQMLETVLEDHFHVQPQKRWGDSSSGIKQGELDLWIGIDQDTPLALLEALNITSYGDENPDAVRDNSFSVMRWKEHLSRVMGDYNKNGFKNILLVSYLDCPAERLAATREEYFNRLKNFDVPRYGAPEYCKTVVVDEFVDGIHVVRADYSSGAGDVTVFHFLVRIEQYGRKALEKAEKKAQKKNKRKK